MKKTSAVRHVSACQNETPMLQCRPTENGVCNSADARNMPNGSRSPGNQPLRSLTRFVTCQSNDRGMLQVYAVLARMQIAHVHRVKVDPVACA